MNSTRSAVLAVLICCCETALLTTARVFAGSDESRLELAWMQGGHNSNVTAICFSADGQLLASWGQDSRIKILRVSDGIQLRSFNGSTNQILSLAFSADASILYSGGQDGTIGLWGIANGNLVGKLVSHSQPVLALAVSPDGRILASGSADNTVKKWRTADGNLERTLAARTLAGHVNQVTSVAISHDGTLLASGNLNAMAELWRISDGTLLQTVWPPTGQVGKVAFSPDDQHLYVGCYAGTIINWNIARASISESVGVGGWTAMDFSANQSSLVLISAGNPSVGVFYYPEVLRAAGIYQPPQAYSCAFSPDGTLAASGGMLQSTSPGFVAPSSLKLWSAANGAIVWSLAGHPVSVNSVGFSSDAGTVISAGNDSSLRVWRSADGGLARYFPINSSSTLAPYASVSPDGTLVASGSGARTIAIRRLPDGVVLSPYIAALSPVCCAAFSPDNSTLALGGIDSTVSLWRTADGTILKTLTSHTTNVTVVAFSPDGTTLASGSADKTVILWRASDGGKLGILRGHEGTISSVAFSPDGALVGTGSWDNTIRLWRTSDQSLQQILTGHTDRVNAVAFTPDGNVLATASDDNSIRFWRTKDGVLLRTTTDETYQTRSLAFSRNGRFLAYGRSDGTHALALNPWWPQPPWITRQPSGGVFSSGANITLAVSAIGDQPIGYQWQFNGTIIAGATNASLNFGKARSLDSGQYLAVLTNLSGATTSKFVTLDIGDPPSIAIQPQSLAVFVGTDVKLMVEAAGTPPIAYYWRRNYSVLAGETNHYLLITNIQPSQSGNYFVTIRNSYGSIASPSAMLKVYSTNAALLPLGLTGWNRDVVVENSAAPYAKALDSDVNGSTFFEAGFLGHMDGLPANRRFGSALPSGTVFELQPYDSANVLWLAQSGSGVLQLTNPARFRRLAILAASGFDDGRGGNAQLRLAFADNTTSNPIAFNAKDWWTAQAPGPMAIEGLGYVGILDETNYTYGDFLRGLSVGFGAGLRETDIDLVALGLDGKVLSSISFTNQSASSALRMGIFAVSGEPVAGGGAPYILEEPVSQIADLGANVTFSVLAVGQPPLSYRWQMSGTNLAGATLPTLTLHGVTMDQARNYSVVVGNALGSVTNSGALLAVNPPSQLRSALFVNVSPAASGSVTLSQSPDTDGKYMGGSVVILTANAAPGYEFVLWGGDTSGSSNPTTVTMNSDRRVTAYFDPARYALSVDVGPSGGGTVKINPPPGADGKYAVGTVVTLNANAASGYRFNSWTGDASGTNNSTTVTMNGNRKVVGNFTELRYTLSVNVNPDGHGTVTLSPSPGADGRYADGTVVTLAANAAPGYGLSSWSGDATGNSNPITITMRGNRNFSATFAPRLATVSLDNFGANAGNGCPIYDWQSRKLIPTGQDFFVQVLCGPIGGALAPAVDVNGKSIIIPMGAGSSGAGYWDAGVGIVPGVAADALAQFQVITWQGDSYDAALMRGASPVWSQATGDWVVSSGFMMGPVLEIPLDSIPVTERSQVTVPGSTGLPGGTISVPVVLSAQGNENSIGCSLSYSTRDLTFYGAALGGDVTGTQDLVQTNEVNGGRIGLTLSLPPGEVFRTGRQQVFVLNFTISASTTNKSVPLSFQNQPVAEKVLGTNANPLSVNFVDGTITIDRGVHIANVSRSGNDVVVSFGVVAGTAYKVESTDSLTDSNVVWQARYAFTNMASGVVQIADAGATITARNRFYRVVAGVNRELISEPAGFCSLALNPGANALVAPLHKLATAVGLITRVNGNTVTLDGSPNWGGNTFAPRNGFSQYVLTVLNDAAASADSPGIQGDWWKIDGNTGNSVILNPGADNLSAVLAVGDRVEICKLMSMHDLFDSGTNVLLNPDHTGDAAFGGSTQADVVRFLHGTSFSAPLFYHEGGLFSAGYYYLGDIGPPDILWVIITVPGGGTVWNGPLDATTLTILPDQAVMVFRAPNSVPTNLVVMGRAPVSRLTHYLQPGPNALGTLFPAATPLGTSNLKESGWHLDHNGAAASGDYSQADVIRPIIGTSFGAPIFYHDGTLAPAGWYSGISPNNSFALEPGQAYIMYINGPDGLRWRQPPPYSP